MKRIAVIGAGTLGVHIAHYLHQDDNMSFAGFYDDIQQKGTTTDYGAVIGSFNDIHSDFEKKVFDQLLIGVGYNNINARQQLYERFASDIPFATYVHPTAYVDPSAEIGFGTVVFPGCVFDRNALIRDNVLLNISCSIAHDTEVNSGCFLGPGVKLSGFVTVGKSCFLGVGTTVINNITVCDNVQTGGGTVVISNINESGVYVGVPSRLIKSVHT
ncbi:sugar O-acyltransferase (sialic acid O-acetyltransferase NeuD family) [Pontibacter aydingkolensis]|uniref:Acetyltransferase n=1 Tax=Pontibacter aydingkolensis TaxID=1911536 RepID=A0ABS7CTQ2_9BACT|nr:acetyltransferase [Pontibacter aydingkolensis]MBW7467222.1 acetyltransferase [Pontibacter aydingkolensis]